MKNEYKHNDDGTTHIFVESKSKRFPGKHTIVIDTEDWDKVREYRSWHLGCPSNLNSKYPYAKTAIPHPDGDWIYRKDGQGRQRRITSLSLHHLIYGKPTKGKQIDHINHSGLDNRRENLREVTPSQNGANTRSFFSGKKNNPWASRYKGVRKRRDLKPGARVWSVRVKHNYKETHIGCFHTEEEAALAYNKKALELWGEHAYLNEVPESYKTKEHVDLT
jgi:hypothetical protein